MATNRLEGKLNGGGVPDDDEPPKTPLDKWVIKDNRETLDNEIVPLIDKVRAICERHQMPFLFTVEYDTSHICVTSRIPNAASSGIHLAAISLTNPENLLPIVERMNASGLFGNDGRAIKSVPLDEDTEKRRAARNEARAKSPNKFDALFEKNRDN